MCGPLQTQRLGRHRAPFQVARERGLQLSPIHEVMIDKALLGWKEFELELLRDSNDNVVIICSIENFDPMGIHTGDSITVAPGSNLSSCSPFTKKNNLFLIIAPPAVNPFKS